MISAFICLPRQPCWCIKMRTSDVTQLMDLALGLWFPFVRI
ncbi:flagellar biosynthetic protein FliR, partial [Escherichia coli]|nr:flagellar biosynthetic protein FliR [Escherichia coli]